MQEHHVRLPEVWGKAGGITGFAMRALVVTALVGGTGAYLHAGVASAGDSKRQGAQHFSAAARYEVAPDQAVVADQPESGATTVAAAETAPTTPGHVVAAVAVRPATLVHVFHDGRSTLVMTTARTVNGTLTQAHISVGVSDIVHPGRSVAPKSGMGIHVVRVRIRIEHSRVSLAFQTVRKADPHLARGNSKVVRKGHLGLARVTYRVVLHDGKVDSRTVTQRTVLKAPVAQLVRYGTKHAARASRSHRSVDALNWHALAVCESGDNPRAVGGGGKFFGLYQFTVGTWHSVGGAGRPADASRAEQTKRAKILYGRRGSAPWPVCGAKLYT